MTLAAWAATVLTAAAIGGAVGLAARAVWLWWKDAPRDIPYERPKRRRRWPTS